MRRGLHATTMLAAINALGHERLVMLVATEDARADAVALLERIGMAERVKVRVATSISGYRPREVIPDDITPVLDRMTMRLHAAPEPTPADNRPRKSKGERKRERRWRYTR